MIYNIPEDNMEALEKKMTRIGNKCKKYGCDFHYNVVGENFVKFGSEEEDNSIIVKMIQVDVEGIAKINDWIFLGSIDHSPAGNILRLVTDEIKVPERYKTAELECEHCHSKRHRAQTYLVYNESTQEFKQVGSSCLCDYTHGLSAELAASLLEFFKHAEDEENAIYDGSFIPVKRYTSILDVLTIAVSIVAHFGYRNSEYYRVSTKSMVMDVLCGVKKLEDWEYEELPGAADKAATILEYFKNLPEEDTKDNNYLYNLHTLAQLENIKNREIGYVSSMVVTYQKAMDKIEYQTKKKEAHDAEVATSQYVGEVGDKVEIKNPKVTVVTSWSNSYNGYSIQTTTRYKIEDETGNVFMWDSSTYIDVDHVISIKGTVKKHDEFNGVKQTWLTRCRSTNRPIEKERAASQVEDGVANFLDELDA